MKGSISYQFMSTSINASSDLWLPVKNESLCKYDATPERVAEHKLMIYCKENREQMNKVYHTSPMNLIQMDQRMAELHKSIKTQMPTLNL